VHPYDALDKITSGPTMLELASGELSLLMTDQTEQRIQARRDALALRAASSPAAPIPAVSTNDKMLRAILAKLWDVPAEVGPGGTLGDVCFMGPESTLEARLGYPLDMAHVVSRVECLVYQGEGEDCFRSFASDVFFANKMLDVACKRAPAGKLGTAKQVGRRQAVVHWVLQTLKELSDAYDAGGVDGVMRCLGNPATEGCAAPRNVPPAPGSCFVCWQKESQEDKEIGNVFVSCDSCGLPAHAHCLFREWHLASMRQEHEGDGGDEGHAKCLVCCAAAKAVTAGAAAAELEAKQRNFPPGGYATLWSLVRSLYAVDFSEWNKEQKLELVRMVTLLVSESPAVRDALEDDAERQRAARQKLATCRAELKALQQDIKKSADDKDPESANAGQNHQGQQGRAVREAESRRDKLVIQVSKIEEELKNFPSNRKQLLGYDRHWNKYWSLPSGSLDRPEPFIIVERDCSSADGIDGPSIAFYRGMDAVKKLTEFVNPKGARESILGDRLATLRDSFDGVASMEWDAGTAVDDGAKAPDALDTSSNTSSSLNRFKAALLEYGSALPDASFHSVRGTRARRDTWSTRAGSVSDPAGALAALVSLERMLDPSTFKVHWRNWGIPAPDPSTAAKSMAPAWLRLENLKKAVKLSSNQVYSLSMLDVRDEDAGGPEADEDQDSEVARTLDAQLNRRRDTKSRRTWEVTSPRNRRGVSVQNYREQSDDDDDEGDEGDEGEGSDGDQNGDDADVQTPDESTDDISE
jgi:hypothetical protein